MLQGVIYDPFITFFFNISNYAAMHIPGYLGLPVQVLTPSPLNPGGHVHFTSPLSCCADEEESEVNSPLDDILFKFSGIKKRRKDHIQCKQNKHAHSEPRANTHHCLSCTSLVHLLRNIIEHQYIYLSITSSKMASHFYFYLHMWYNHRL